MEAGTWRMQGDGKGWVFSSLDGQRASLCRLREARRGHSTQEREARAPRAQAQRRAGTCLPFGRDLSRVEVRGRHRGGLGKYPGHGTGQGGAVREAAGLAKASDWLGEGDSESGSQSSEVGAQ